MCGRYHFSAELLDEIRDITEQKDWKLELGVLDRDIHPGDGHCGSPGRGI